MGYVGFQALAWRKDTKINPFIISPPYKPPPSPLLPRKPNAVHNLPGEFFIRRALLILFNE
jgi:hypothetical protein